jgi:hypothetical protein
MAFATRRKAAAIRMFCKNPTRSVLGDRIRLSGRHYVGTQKVAAAVFHGDGRVC